MNSDGYTDMTGDVSTTADDIDPERLYADGAVTTAEATFDHDDPDYCEAGMKGRAVLGVTAPDGRVLLVANPDIEHALLPNALVDPDEEWAEAAREHLRASAGIDVVLDGVRLVRRVYHTVDGEVVETTHHVVFAASAPSDAIPDGLCDDNDWELGWFDAHPYPDDEVGDGHSRRDIQRFLGGEA
jgi:ADP-ribose pyrophosphatase YjhB (NUDIX family)